MDLVGFRKAIGDIKTEDNPVLVKQKSRDFFWYSPVLKRQLENVTADVVVTPKSEAEVVRIVAAAYAHDVPLTPRGAGSGLTGGCLPVRGGVVLSVETMQRIKEISPDDMVAVVEPGALNVEVKRAAAEHGLWYPPDPSSFEMCTIGGNIANGSPIGDTPPMA